MTTATVPISSPTVRGGSIASVFSWELRKLSAQRRTQLLVVACAVAPILFVAALQLQSSAPVDTLFGRHVHDSGFAASLVTLGFVSQWALPALISVVAGDLFSGEDRLGTWGILLTRSRSRSEVFAGKVLVATMYTVLVVTLLAVSGLLAGMAFIGRQPLVGLSGQLIPPGDCAGLILAAWASMLPPALAFTALSVLVSVLTRNGVLGVAGPIVVGLLLQLVALVNAPVLVRSLLLSTAFDGWHGLFASPAFTGPLVRGIVISAGYVVVLLVVAHRVLRRRDVLGG